MFQVEQLIIIINYSISPAVLRKIKKEEGKSRKSVENCFSQINTTIWIVRGSKNLF